MSPDAATAALRKHDEALTFVRSLGDAQREQFIMRFVTIMMVRVARGERPVTPLDMQFVVECASALYDQREALRRIFDGEDLRWWGDP